MTNTTNLLYCKSLFYNCKSLFYKKQHTLKQKGLVLFIALYKDAVKGWLPNLITISGMLCIPFIIDFQNQKMYTQSIILFGIAWSMDYFDGKAARVFGQSSHTGAFLDPLADKVFTITFLLYFWAETYVIISVPIISIGVTLTTLRIYKILYGKKTGVAPNIMASISGKVKTNIEKVGIGIFMLIPTLDTYFGIGEAVSVGAANTTLGISLFFALFSLSHQIRQI